MSKTRLASHGTKKEHAPGRVHCTGKFDHENALQITKQYLLLRRKARKSRRNFLQHPESPITSDTINVNTRYTRGGDERKEKGRISVMQTAVGQNASASAALHEYLQRSLFEDPSRGLDFRPLSASKALRATLGALKATDS